MEIEIRAAINNLTEIESKILEKGAILFKEKQQEDVYFGEMCLYEKIGYSFMMRVRDEEGNIFLTYKGARTNKDGEWEEYEFPVENKLSAVEMLKSMGLEKIVQISKKRKEYKFGDFSICLDNIEELGNFIEIEYLSSDADEGKRRLMKLARDFNIGDEDIIQKGYITMLLVKNKSPYSRYIKN